MSYILKATEHIITEFNTSEIEAEELSIQANDSVNKKIEKDFSITENQKLSNDEIAIFIYRSKSLVILTNANPKPIMFTNPKGYFLPHIAIDHQKHDKSCWISANNGFIYLINEHGIVIQIREPNMVCMHASNGYLYIGLSNGEINIYKDAICVSKSSLFSSIFHNFTSSKNSSKILSIGSSKHFIFYITSDCYFHVKHREGETIHQKLDLDFQPNSASISADFSDFGFVLLTLSCCKDSRILLYHFSDDIFNSRFICNQSDLKLATLSNGYVVIVHSSNEIEDQIDVYSSNYQQIMSIITMNHDNYFFMTPIVSTRFNHVILASHNYKCSYIKTNKEFSDNDKSLERAVAEVQEKIVMDKFNWEKFKNVFSEPLSVVVHNFIINNCTPNSYTDSPQKLLYEIIERNLIKNEREAIEADSSEVLEILDDINIEDLDNSISNVPITKTPLKLYRSEIFSKSKFDFQKCIALHLVFDALSTINFANYQPVCSESETSLMISESSGFDRPDTKRSHFSLWGGTEHFAQIDYVTQRVQTLWMIVSSSVFNNFGILDYDIDNLENNIKKQKSYILFDDRSAFELIKLKKSSFVIKSKYFSYVAKCMAFLELHLWDDFFKTSSMVANPYDLLFAFEPLMNNQQIDILFKFLSLFLLNNHSNEPDQDLISYLDKCADAFIDFGYYTESFYLFNSKLLNHGNIEDEINVKRKIIHRLAVSIPNEEFIQFPFGDKIIEVCSYLNSEEQIKKNMKLPFLDLLYMINLKYGFNESAADILLRKALTLGKNPYSDIFNEMVDLLHILITNHKIPKTKPLNLQFRGEKEEFEKEAKVIFGQLALHNEYQLFLHKNEIRDIVRESITRNDIDVLKNAEGKSQIVVQWYLEQLNFENGKKTPILFEKNN